MPDQNGKQTNADKLETAYATIKPYIEALRNLESTLPSLVVAVNQTRYGTVQKPKTGAVDDVYGTFGEKERAAFILEKGGDIETAIGEPLDAVAFTNLLQYMTTNVEVGNPLDPEDAMRAWMKVIKAVKG